VTHVPETPVALVTQISFTQLADPVARSLPIHGIPPFLLGQHTPGELSCHDMLVRMLSTKSEQNRIHRCNNNAVHGSYKVVSMLFIAKAVLK